MANKDWIAELKSRRDRIKDELASYRGGALPSRFRQRRYIHPRGDFLQGGGRVPGHPPHRPLPGGPGGLHTPHSLLRAGWGAVSGHYSFNGMDLVRAKPQVKELVREARKVLKLKNEPHVPVSEACEATDLTPRQVIRLAQSERIAHSRASSGGLVVSLYDLLRITRGEELEVNREPQGPQAQE